MLLSPQLITRRRLIATPSLAAADLGVASGFAANLLDTFFVASQSKYGSAYVSSPSFNGAPIDLFTYTSPSTKYLQNAGGALYTVSGGALPFEWQAAALVGLRVEPQATNLRTRSAEFSQAPPWQAFNAAVTADVVAGPDGNAVADKIYESNTTTNRHMLFPSAVTTVSSTRYCFSVFAKAAERSYLGLSINSNSGAQRYGRVFNLASGTLGSDTNVGSATGTNSGIEAWGNGWYRCWVTMDATSTSSSGDIGPSDSGSPSFAFGMPSYVGVTNSGIYAWGAQFEAGDFPSSYIPTTTASVTRNADVIGPALSAFPWNGGSGTYTVDGVSASPADNGSILTIARRSGQTHIQTVKWTVP